MGFWFRLRTYILGRPCQSLAGRPLNHEIGNHAMEDSSVVERILALGSGRGMGPLPPAFGKLGEVGHGAGFELASIVLVAGVPAYWFVVGDLRPPESTRPEC